MQLEGEELTQVELWERALRTERFAELAASLQGTVGWAPNVAAREVVAIQSALSEHEYTDYQGFFHHVEIPVSRRSPLPGCPAARMLAGQGSPPTWSLPMRLRPSCLLAVSLTSLPGCMPARHLPASRMPQPARQGCLRDRWLL